MLVRAALAAALAGTLALNGCATRLGPRTIPAARFDYNQRITQSQNDQLLLNLVRLRYRDTPLFLDVGTVIAQYTLDARVGALPRIGVDGTGRTEAGVDLGARYREQPTITYEPISGAEFTRRLLTPISPATIILLSQSGWSVERLLMCCVDRINGVSNAPVASGPTPSLIPDNSQFRAVARAFRALQLEGELDFVLEQDHAAGGALVRIDNPTGEDPRSEALRILREALDLDPETAVFRVTARSAERGRNEITLTGRSVLGALFFLSHSVEPPAEHLERGLVTVAEQSGGRAANWDEVSGGVLRVSSSASEPSGAFVRIRYRDHWFYIRDDDLSSKASFSLLTYLLSLQAAGQEGISAMLTVPVGN